jgi:hypothetical protein
MDKETYYFSHDYNTREDEKIKELIYLNGMTGYGIYWAIIETLYQNANALRTNYARIAFDLHLTTHTIVESVITEFELFNFSENKEYFYSNSVERRLDKRSEKSKKARESALIRWNKNTDDANALQTESDSNAIKESKVKESKVNILLKKETKKVFDFKEKLIDFGFSKNLVEDWMKVRRTKKATNTETAFKKFISEVQKVNKGPDEIIELCISKDWKGFEAKWIDNLQNQNLQNGKSNTNFGNGKSQAYTFDAARIIEANARKT